MCATHKALHSTIHDFEIFDSPQAQTVEADVALQNIPRLQKCVETRSLRPSINHRPVLCRVGLGENSVDELVSVVTGRKMSGIVLYGPHFVCAESLA